MHIQVFRRQDESLQLLGSCELSHVSGDLIEVVQPVERTDWWLPGNARLLDAHRFDVLRMPGRSGERLALVPYEDASPDVLPGWEPAAA